MQPCLIVVARERLDVFAVLAEYATSEDIRIILDRRARPRRLDRDFHDRWDRAVAPDPFVVVPRT